MSEERRYKIVKANSDTELELEVTEYLKRGWKVTGGLQVAKMNSQPIFYQAIYTTPLPPHMPR